MAAAMNGMALHGGVIPVRRHVPVLSPTIRAPVDPPRRADGHARHPRDDARFHRPRRRRPDAPAGRASRRAARDPEPLSSSARPTRLNPPSAGKLALLRENGPSLLALSRQATPALRDDAQRKPAPRAARTNCCRPKAATAKSRIFATGTEVAIAVKARELLQAQGIPTRVVSAPCFELFDLQDDAYQDASAAAAPTKSRIGCEAAHRAGLVEMFASPIHRHDRFGASAPAKDVLRAFRHYC